jgi:hypothetical protein
VGGATLEGRGGKQQGGDVKPQCGRSPLEIWLAGVVLCLSTVALLLGSAPLSTLGVIGTAISFGVLLGAMIASG